MSKTDKKEWDKEWQNMPEYCNKKLNKAEITATFKFRNQEDFEKFKKLIKKHLFNNEKPFDGSQKKNCYSAWYPLGEKGSKYRYVDES